MELFNWKANKKNIGYENEIQKFQFQKFVKNFETPIALAHISQKHQYMLQIDNYFEFEWRFYF